jgi:hypothetical protein
LILYKVDPGEPEIPSVSGPFTLEAEEGFVQRHLTPQR